MTTLTACPVCGKPRPADRPGNQPWCCSLACYHTFHGITEPVTPSCHDAVTMTMTCPICQRRFTPVGRQKFCSDACRAAAYRRRVTPTGRPFAYPKHSPDAPSPSTSATAAALAPSANNDANNAARSCAKSGSEANAQAAPSPSPSPTCSPRR
jgi:hypothetical protein